MDIFQPAPAGDETKDFTLLNLILLTATDPAVPPQPGLRPGLTEDQITPGLLGFIITFSIVVVMTFLIRDMVKRVRRVRYRAQVEAERLGAEPEHMGIPIMSEAEMKSASYSFEKEPADSPGDAAPEAAEAPDSAESK